MKAMSDNTNNENLRLEIIESCKAKLFTGQRLKCEEEYLFFPYCLSEMGIVYERYEKSRVTNDDFPVNDEHGLLHFLFALPLRRATVSTVLDFYVQWRKQFYAGEF